MENIRILVIEDDKVDQMAFKRFAKDESLSYDYTIAGSVSEVKKILDSKGFDIVITDYLLGDGTAFDIFDLTMDTPIIIITGSGDEEIAVKAMKRGACDYVIKDPERNYLKVLPITIESAIKHKKAEKQIRMLSHAIMSINDSVYVTDVDDRIIFVNKVFCKTYGYEEEDILGRDSNVLAEVGLKNEVYQKRKDGSEFPISLSRSVIKDENGNEVAVVGVARDITERKRAEEELRILNAIMEAVHKSSDLREVFNIAIDKVMELTDIDIVGIYLVDKNTNEAVLETHRGYTDKYVERAGRIPYPKGVTWKVINSGEIYIVQDVITDPYVGPAGKESGFQSFMAIPIKIGDKTVGTVNFHSYKKYKFGKQEIDLFSSIGNQIAIAIAKAKQTKELEERNKNLSLLSMISQSVHQSVDLDQIYRTVLDVTKELKFIDLMVVYLVEGEGNKREAVLQIHWGYSDEYLKKAGRISYGKGVTWKVITSGEPIYYENASDPSTPVGPAGKALGARALLSVPVKSGGETIGVIHFSSLDRTSFTKQELDFLLSLGNQIGTAITKAKVFKALLHSEGQYRTLVETARDVIFTLSTDGTITSLNPAFETLTGWKRAEWLGKHFASLVHPDDLPLAMDLFQRVLQGETPPIFEFRIPSKSGEYLIAEFTITLELRDGRVVRGFGIARDITERKRAEKKIRKLNEELEQRVIERTAELEATNKELEAFSYSVSHDLRAPLRHLSGFAELLQKNASSTLDEKSHRYLMAISESANRMGNLIDDLLAFSRVGRAEMQKTEVSLEQLVKESLNDLRSEINGRNIVWKIGTLSNVHGDPSMLRLALVNLISNALKFTRTRMQAEIEIGCTDGKENEIIVFIRDNGVGFDMKYMDRLFGVFQRLHPAKEFEGTGIGLANVQRIIHRHGGRVWAEGLIDGGATFYFSLSKS